MDNEDRALKQVKLATLWKEIARRLGIKFGRVQMAFHDGNPSPFVEIETRVGVNQEQENLFRAEVGTKQKK